MVEDWSMRDATRALHEALSAGRLTSAGYFIHIGCESRDACLGARAEIAERRSVQIDPVDWTAAPEVQGWLHQEFSSEGWSDFPIAYTYAENGEAMQPLALGGFAKSEWLRSAFRAERPMIIRTLDDGADEAGWTVEQRAGVCVDEEGLRPLRRRATGGREPVNEDAVRDWMRAHTGTNSSHARKEFIKEYGPGAIKAARFQAIWNEGHGRSRGRPRLRREPSR